MLYTCATRETKLFSDAKLDSQESRLGSKCAYFHEEGSFFLVSVRGIRDFTNSSIPQNGFPHKMSCLGVKLGGKIAQNSNFGMFFLERANLNEGMFWKSLVIHTTLLLGNLVLADCLFLIIAVLFLGGGCQRPDLRRKGRHLSLVL